MVAYECQKLSTLLGFDSQGDPELTGTPRKGTRNTDCEKFYLKRIIRIT
jgi:hypothetical protein